MKDLTSEAVGKRVLVRARLHTTRGTGSTLSCLFFCLKCKILIYDCGLLVSRVILNSAILKWLLLNVLKSN